MGQELGAWVAAHPSLLGWALTALVLFWGVGAYNRLVRLRTAFVIQFAAVDEQLSQRQALLTQWLDTLTPALPQATDRLEALRAACQQLDAARAHVRQRPRVAAHMASLRLADEILSDARARLPAQGAPGLDLAPLNAQLSATDATLALVRRQFNEAVAAYNAAVRQFPTVMLVGLLGFRQAPSF